MTLTLSADSVAPESDIEAVVRTEPPRGGEVSLATDLADRFEGFEVGGSYSGPDGALHLRLVPVAGAPRYRVRPFGVVVKSAAGASDWFATDPLEIPSSPVAGADPGMLSGMPGFVAVRPSARAALRIAAAALGGAAALALVAFGISRLARMRRVRRLSPRERAMLELRQLLARNLPGRDRFKDYYIELTMVVRRYFERRHGLRAPRQTTEEFLAAAVSRGPEFGAETVAGLRAFLEAADLVKFAGRTATVETAAAAAERARDCIEGDDSAAAAREAAK